MTALSISGVRRNVKVTVLSEFSFTDLGRSAASVGDSIAIAIQTHVRIRMFFIIVIVGYDSDIWSEIDGARLYQSVRILVVGYYRYGYVRMKQSQSQGQFALCRSVNYK